MIDKLYSAGQACLKFFRKNEKDVCKINTGVNFDYK